MAKVIPLRSHTQENLTSVWSVDDESHLLIRGPILSSREQTNAWLNLIRSFPLRKKRWVSQLMAMPDIEWPIITSEHFYLEGSWIPHIVIPMPLISPPQKEESRSDLQWKTIWKFIQQINCEGWLFYSEWLDDEMELAVSKFYKDASEEFQVEAALKDFHHEITSFLLRDYRINCAKLVLQLGQSAQEGTLDRQKGFDMEIGIVRLHFEILHNLNIQRDVLLNIERAIAKVQKQHAELVPLKQTVHLLSLLLGPPLSWIQNLLFCGLLNHQLDVGVYVHCNHGFDRTNLAFAVQLALKEMLTKFSVGELLAFAEAYPESGELCRQFKSLVKQYLLDLCVTLTHSNPAWKEWMPDQARIDAFLDGKEQKAL